MKTKNIVIVSCIVLLVILAMVVVVKTDKQKQNEILVGNVLGVDQIAVDPTSYTGKIVVDGAVSFVYPEQSTFVIIDKKEYSQCGVVTCAINHLTVKYSKQLPSVKDIVEIKGELAKINQSFVLNAEEIKIK